MLMMPRRLRAALSAPLPHITCRLPTRQPPRHERCCLCYVTRYEPRLMPASHAYRFCERRHDIAARRCAYATSALALEARDAAKRSAPRGTLPCGSAARRAAVAAQCRHATIRQLLDASALCVLRASECHAAARCQCRMPDDACGCADAPRAQRACCGFRCAPRCLRKSGVIQDYLRCLILCL